MKERTKSSASEENKENSDRELQGVRASQGFTNAGKI